jgi:hypothetical protein
MCHFCYSGYSTEYCKYSHKYIDHVIKLKESMVKVLDGNCTINILDLIDLFTPYHTVQNNDFRIGHSRKTTRGYRKTLKELDSKLQDKFIHYLENTVLDFQEYIEIVSVLGHICKEGKFVHRVKNALFKYNKKKFNIILNVCIMKYFRKCDDREYTEYMDFLKFVGKYNCRNKIFLIRSIYEQSLSFFEFKKFKDIFKLSDIDLYSELTWRVYEPIDKYVIPVLSPIVMEYLCECE